MILRAMALLMLLAVNARAQEKALVVRDVPLPVTNLAPYVSIFVDPTAAMDIGQVMTADFAAAMQDPPSFGITRHAVWVRFTVRSAADRRQDLIAELLWARLSHLTWYVVADGRVVKSSVGGAADEPPRTDRMPIIELDVPPGAERTVYLRAESDTSILLPLRIGSVAVMRQFEQRQTTGGALQIGFCLALAFLSLLVGWVQRSRLYLYLAAIALSYALYYAIYHGYAALALSGAPLWVERQMFGMVFALLFFFFAVFNGSFIGRARMNRREQWLQRLAEGITLAGVLAFLVFDFRTAIRLAVPLPLIGILTGLVLVLARRERRPAEIWLAAALAAFVPLLLLGELQLKGVVPVLIPFWILQLLMWPSILTVFFVVAMVRQRASEAEKQQRAAERQAHELVANIEAGTYEVALEKDAQGVVGPQFQFASPQFLEMFGLEREALLADPSIIASRIHPDDAARLNAANDEAYEKSEAFRWEGRVVVRGETRWFVIASTPRRNSNGTVLWSGLVTDVTTEREAQAAFRKTLEDLPVAVACGTLDDPPRISLMNEQFVKAFGYTPEETPTVELWAERAYPDPDYRREVMGWWQEALDQAVRERGKVGSREIRVTCKDGSVKEVIVSATVLPSGPVVTFQDVTERNRVARELEAARRNVEKSAYELTENMPAGTYVVSLTPRADGGVDLAFRFASGRFLEFFGVEREALMRNPNIVIDSFHPDDRENMNESNAKAFATGQPFRWEGRTLVDGKTRWVNISSNPRTAADGVTVWEGVVTDITPRVEAEQKLAKALEAKGQFLAKMSHEIRTPLSALVSLAQAMWMRGEEQELDPKFNQFLNRVRSGGQYLNLLLRNVLNVSAAESGRVPVKASEFYLADWVTEIRNVLDPIAEYHRSRIEWTMPSDDEARFRTDQMRLTQIALNLGENALKFSAGQDSPVRIAVDKSGDRLRLVVEDHGPGIPPEKTKAIFEEFSQAGTEVSPLDEGVGLGLAVVRINTDLLGGTVRVQSLEPHGTRFLVEIPEMEQGA